MNTKYRFTLSLLPFSSSIRLLMIAMVLVSDSLYAGNPINQSIVGDGAKGSFKITYTYKCKGSEASYKCDNGIHYWSDGDIKPSMMEDNNVEIRFSDLNIEPKFSKVYIIGDSITVTGNGVSYAGKGLKNIETQPLLFNYTGKGTNGIITIPYVVKLQETILSRGNFKVIYQVKNTNVLASPESTSPAPKIETPETKEPVEQPSKSTKTVTKRDNLSADEEDWKVAIKTNTIESYEDYLDKQPNGKHLEDAKSKLDLISPMELSVEKGSGKNEFIYTVIHGKKTTVVIDSSNGMTVSQKDNRETSTFTFTILDGNKHTVIFKDAANTEIRETIDPDYIPLNILALKEDDRSFTVTIEGGKGDLRIQLRGAGRSKEILLKRTEVIAQKEYNITKDSVGSRTAIPLDGDYIVKVTDSEGKSADSKSLEQKVHITPKSSNSWLYILIAALSLGIGGIGYWFYRKRAMQRAKEQQQILKQRQEGKKSAKNTVIGEMAFNPISDSPSNNPISQSKIAGGGMQIKTKRPVSAILDSAADNYDELLLSKNHYRFPMNEHWANTILTDVFMSKKVFGGIDIFIRMQNNRNFEEVDDAIPEIGGFLLGYYFKRNDKYYVTLEEFSAITETDTNDVYKVEFGAQAWKKVDDLKDQFPELSLIGWFHTHPGHSLFLSAPDLRIQNGFFTESYHLAMEMDTKTLDLDTAFFTRTVEGQANNTPDRITGRDWFKWSDVDRWSRS